MSSNLSTTFHEQTRPVVAGESERLPAVLRGVAGAPAAWRQQRRGSFLVIVVGTLALLAVIMLVYVSVGNQDTRTKAALARRERLDDVPQQFADYLSVRIIGADALATYYDNSGLRSSRNGAPVDEPVLMREAFDYGYTDWTRQSDSLERDKAFNPVGSYVRLRDPALPAMPSKEDPDPGYTGSLPARWNPSDPWLASNEPTWLGYSATGNDFSQGVMTQMALEPAQLKKDWLHLSNVAPDGKFVNLYNLSPLVGGRRVGNFNARPGFGTSSEGLGPLPRLSEGLSLLKGTTNFGEADTSSNETAWGAAVSGAKRNFPAFWDSWQRGLFRPATDLRGGANGPSTSNYLPYQFADADGDGMFDSRWMQLTDSRLFDLSGDPSRIVDLLDTDGKFRYFFAVRIIDASGMVNVNTATDFAAAPDATHPVGLTPADVDLRRLLTLHDVYDGYRSKPSEFPIQLGRSQAGYDGIRNPSSDDDPNGVWTANYGPVLGISPSAVCPPEPKAGYDAIRAYTVGSTAYTAVRLSLASGTFVPLASAIEPTLQYRGIYLQGLFARDAFEYSGYDIDRRPTQRDSRDSIARRLWDFVPGQADFDAVFPTIADYQSTWPPDRPPILTNAADAHSPPFYTPDSASGEGFYPSLPRRRAEYYASQASAIQSTLATLLKGSGTALGISQFQSVGSFGIDDMAELVTYRASNDSAVLSNLERVVGGRDLLGYAADSTSIPDPRRLDPLRSNRGPEYELVRDLATGTGNPQDGDPPSSLADGRTDVKSRLQLDADVRQRLTTISGARSLYTKRDVNFDKIEDSELRSSATQLIQNIVSYPDQPIALGSVNSLFGTYCNALLPYSDLAATWDRGNGQFNNFKTMCYGYDGAETAIFAAAHMAANMADLADVDTNPSAWTLILNNASYNGLSTNPNFPFWHESFTGAGDGRRLDLDAALGLRGTGATRLASAGSGGSLLAPAVNIYGVEPQPFVTAVATFTVYTDRPESSTPAGSHDGWDPTDPGATPRPVDIRPDVTEFNYDLLYRVVAFRIHNPFGTDITLGNPSKVMSQSDPTSVAIGAYANQIDLGDADAFALDRQKDFYYLKFGGRTFMLTGLREEADTTTGDYPASPIGGGLDITPQTITIKAGASVVVYATSQIPRTVIEKNIMTADPGFVIAGGNKRAVIHGLIEKQLKSGATANPDDAYFWIPEIDTTPTSPSVGQLGAFNQSRVPNGQGTFKPWRDSSGTIDARAFGQLMQQNPHADHEIQLQFTQPGTPPEDKALLQNTEVQLWHAVRAGVPNATNPAVALEYETESIAVPGSTWDGGTPLPATSARAYVRNDYTNDQLVDRFRVPLKTASNNFVDLDARIKTAVGAEEADMEVAGSDDPGGQYLDGVTMTLWASARRPQDPSIASDKQIPLGALPGFCLEAKNPGDNSATPPVASWNTYATQNQTTGIAWDRIKSDYFSDDTISGKAAELNVRQWALKNLANTYCPAIAFSSTEKLPAVRGWETSTLLRPMLENTTVRGGDIPYNEQYAQLIVSNAPTSSSAVGERFTSTFIARNTASNLAKSHSTLRVADMLLPMGIGPVEAPVNAAGAVNTDLNIRWTTLGEALTISLGYDLSVPATDVASLMMPRQIGIDPAVAGRKLYRHFFDRGNLVLDDFAPFYNTDGDAVGTFKPGNGADRRLFTQIPLALNVLDMFSASVAGDESVTKAVPGLVNINTAPLAVARCLPMLSPLSRAAASEVKTVKITAAVGTTFTLSVNRGGSGPTAAIPVGATPSMVQSALESLPGIGRGNVWVTAGDPENPGTGWDPGLSPYLGAHYIVTFTGSLSMMAGLDLTCSGGIVATAVAGSGNRVGPGWWGEGASIDQSVDLAATLVANRDKVEVPLRPQSWATYDPSGSSVSLQSVRYVPYTSTLAATTPDHDVNDQLTRGVQTDIPALSEYPGFQSLGSLMTLRYRGRDLGAVDRYEASLRTSIDYMGFKTDPVQKAGQGFRNRNQSAIGIDSVLMGKYLPVNASDYAAPPPVTPVKEAASTDGMDDEFKEKLAIANAVVNTTSTRSDYFVAWFLVHGYQQSDVENLGVSDVLTPSIARRFVMVVDRSNVVKTGDKPRVLLFKEVPVSGR